MTAVVTLFDPTAPRDGVLQRRAIPARLNTLAGAVVGFIDNAKPNFHNLVDDLAELLIQRHGVARVVKQRKPSASMPAAPRVIDALVGECDVVIAGSGD